LYFLQGDGFSVVLEVKVSSLLFRE
jgi:hypothetical protein